MSYDARGEGEIYTVVFVVMDRKKSSSLVIAGLKLMEMWMVVAAAGCGLLAKCWNMISSNSQVVENESAHINSNPGLANEKDRSGERIRQQEILQESHFEENPDMLADHYVGEFGFGRRYDESWKRGSSAFRRRARVLRAAINKPMSSLESCLTSYEINSSSCISCGRQRQRPLLFTDGINTRGAGISPLVLPISITDCLLPFHNDINSDEPGSVPITGLPLLRQCSQSSRNADTSASYRLVCFGIGIGIMSTIMSSKREMERLTCLLKQKEELVEDLEEELEMRGSWTVKDATDEARNGFETWQQTDTSLDALSTEACEVERTSGTISVKNMENVTSVEKELEVQLEKLGFNLHSPNHQRKFLRINEIDPDCSADVVSGQLREDGLMCNAESEEDNNSSIHEEFNTENFAVSPRDLERCLHEVIISRLQDQIAELETELEGSQTKLQAIKLALKQSNELNQTSQSLNSESPQGLQMAANRIYQASQVGQVASHTFTNQQVYFGNGYPSWVPSYSALEPMVQSDSTSMGKSTYNQPSTLPAQGKQQPHHRTSEMGSNSVCPRNRPQAFCNQPDSSTSPVEGTCATNGNKILVGSVCNIDSLVRDQRVVYGGEEADQEIQIFETRSSEILNSSINSANPNALTKDENFSKDPSARKLNPRKPGKTGQIKSGLDFDHSVATSTLNVGRPYFNKGASTDCISPCHASVTYSEMDFDDIPIIDAEFDKFMSDFLMDFGLDSEEVGSVSSLLDHPDDLSKLSTENQSCGNAIQTVTEP